MVSLLQLRDEFASSISPLRKSQIYAQMAVLNVSIYAVCLRNKVVHKAAEGRHFCNKQNTTEIILDSENKSLSVEQAVVGASVFVRKYWNGYSGFAPKTMRRAFHRLRDAGLWHIPPTVVRQHDSQRLEQIDLIGCLLYYETLEDILKDKYFPDTSDLSFLPKHVGGFMVGTYHAIFKQLGWVYRQQKDRHDLTRQDVVEAAMQNLRKDSKYRFNKTA